MRDREGGRERERQRKRKFRKGRIDRKLERIRNRDMEKERGREGVKCVKTLIKGNKWTERERVTEKEKEP